MRIKENDITSRLRPLNYMIKSQGIEIVLGKRYGYKALDLYKVTGECVDTVATGMSTSETYNYVNAMIKGIQFFTWANK